MDVVENQGRGKVGHERSNAYASLMGVSVNQGCLGDTNSKVFGFYSGFLLFMDTTSSCLQFMFHLVMYLLFHGSDKL